MTDGGIIERQKDGSYVVCSVAALTSIQDEVPELFPCTVRPAFMYFVPSEEEKEKALAEDSQFGSCVLVGEPPTAHDRQELEHLVRSALEQSPVGEASIWPPGALLN